RPPIWTHFTLWHALPPAAQGPFADLKRGTGLAPTRPCSHGFIDQPRGCAAIWGADHSSSSSPQIAAAFFLRTRRAAASAKARSFRASSRSKALIRLRSSFEVCEALAV